MPTEIDATVFDEDAVEVNIVEEVDINAIVEDGDVVFSFEVTDTGPQGKKGDKGDKGDQGDPGVVQSVVAGLHILVDNTDPANPIISTIGGGTVDSVFGRTGVVTAQNGDYTASQLTNVPSGSLAATNVQSALNELNSEKANLAGATFTGDILVPDEVYGPSWNGSLEVPTKNALFDKLETFVASGTLINKVYEAQKNLTSSGIDVLTGAVNGSNTTFVVPQGVYGSFTLQVYLNGMLQSPGDAITETNPATGTFDFVDAPEIGDQIFVIYQLTDVSSSGFENPLTFGNGLTRTVDTVTINTAITVDKTTAQTLTNKTLTSPVINGSLSGTAIVDEDDMVSNSATKVPTQQSVKAYVDANVGGGGSGTVDTIVAGNNIDVDATDPANPIVSVETLVAADISDVTATATELNYTDGVTSAIQTQIDGKQASDSDLTAIAGLSPSNDDIIQRKAGAWTNRTPAQFKTDLSLTKSDVGLGNVDNTSDANKPISTATQSALNNKQDLDSDLTSIAALTPTNDDIIQRKAGAWTNRTLAQLLTDLNLGALYQPLDSDLTTIAGLTATTDNFIVSVSSAWASRTPAQVRTTLGLVIGTNVQAWDADLDTWATKTAPSGTVVGTTDTQTLTNKTMSLASNTFNGLTSGSIPYYNGTTLTENNSNLFWDNANNRIGIRVTSPLQSIHTAASIAFGGATNYIMLTGTPTAAARTWTFQDTTDTIVGRATTDTLTNKTIDANGTGNSISNLEVADLASGVLDTDLSSVSGSDDTIPSAKATKAMGDLKLAKASNLSDVASAATSATNLGLGTGDSPQFTAVNIGHASDTTITRTGAGDIAIEGNAVYRAGGTDVAIADGGTGASSAATAFSNLKQDATTSATGVVELATTAETDTGTDTVRAVTPDGLSGSVYGTKAVSIQVLSGTTALTSADGQAYFRIPTALNGMDLISVGASVLAKSTSGTPTIQIARGRQANATTAHAFTDMLSTRITIDANEFDSKDAATAAVIDTSADDVLTGDLIRVDVDVPGTGTTGLNITMAFRTP